MVRKTKLDWSKQGLGTANDTEVAERLRMDVATVRRHRQRLGIAPFHQGAQKMSYVEPVKKDIDLWVTLFRDDGLTVAEINARVDVYYGVNTIRRSIRTALGVVSLDRRGQKKKRKK